MRKIFKVITAPILLICSMTNALAELVTFEITATVYNISDPSNALQNSVSPGDTITGTYTIDTATPDSDPYPDQGHYMFNSSSTTAPTLGVDFILNNHSLKSDPTVPGHMYEAHIMNSNGDHFGLVSWGNMPLANGSMVNDIFLDLYDSTGQALTTTALTNQAPNVSAFELHDIHIAGNGQNGDYFNIVSKITSIQTAAGQCAPANSNIVTFEVNASIREIWDSSNALGSSIQIGDSISGTYTFDTKTPDMDSNSQVGRYEHTPGSGSYGYDININGANLKADSMLDLFTITIGDNLGNSDFYNVDQYGTRKPFLNNTFIDAMGIYIDDPSGTLVSSPALSNQPPNLSNAGYKDFYFGGMTNGGASQNYFSVVATVNSIVAVPNCEEPQGPIVVSPSSGVFDRMQNFDAAIILDSGLAPLINMQGTLNGFDITPKLNNCFPGAQNSQNRQTFICPGFSNLLMPGANTLNFSFTLSDGTSINHNVDWLLLGY